MGLLEKHVAAKSRPMSLVWYPKGISFGHSPRLDGNSLVLLPRCLKIRGIATPVCALVRNDRLFSNSPIFYSDQLSRQVITLVLDNLGGEIPEGFDAGLKGLVLVANLDFLVPGCPPGAL